MSSGNSDDPPESSHGAERNVPAQGSSTEETEQNVAEETEEVFRSYVFFRYQQEEEERGAAMPRDNEITSLQQNLSSIPTQVGRRLALIGDDINERYESEFRSILQSLKPTSENIYEIFCKIATSLFDSGINWGRVIALLGFGYHMALYVFQHGMSGFLSQIAHFVADFMLRNRIAQWIASNGGWVAALELDNVYIKYLLVLLAAVLIGQYVIRRFFS